MLKDYKFRKTIKFLKTDNSKCENVLKDKGVYIVIYEGRVKPKFISEGTGGWFKGKNPNVPVERLDENWIDFKEEEDRILYIGKAGKKEFDSRVTLKQRIRTYMKFGSGKPVAHWGGRFIWQISNSDDLIIIWKYCEDPLKEEKKLLKHFFDKHGRLPFANLIM